MPEEVPGHVYSELRRLRCLALAGTNAKKEFLLTDGDLRAIPHVDKTRCGGVYMGRRAACQSLLAGGPEGQLRGARSAQLADLPPGLSQTRNPPALLSPTPLETPTCPAHPFQGRTGHITHLPPGRPGDHSPLQALQHGWHGGGSSGKGRQGAEEQAGGGRGGRGAAPRAGGCAGPAGCPAQVGGD